MWIVRQFVDLIGFALAAKRPRQLPDGNVKELVSFMMDESRNYYVFDDIEVVQSGLVQQSDLVVGSHDMGAGSRRGSRTSNRKLGSILRHAVSPPPKCRNWFRLAAHLGPQVLIEVGTSVGVSTLYLAAASTSGTVYALDGNPKLLAIARAMARKLKLGNIEFVEGNFDQTLPGLIEDIDSPDLVFLDGNHRFGPTLHYANLVLAKMQTGSLLVIDDIRWSKEMWKAWQRVAAHEKVTDVVDCYSYGLLFVNEEQAEKTHTRLIPGIRRPLGY